jgi:hypothetical protein
MKPKTTVGLELLDFHFKPGRFDLGTQGKLNQRSRHKAVLRVKRDGMTDELNELLGEIGAETIICELIAADSSSAGSKWKGEVALGRRGYSPGKTVNNSIVVTFPIVLEVDRPKDAKALADLYFGMSERGISQVLATFSKIQLDFGDAQA